MTVETKNQPYLFQAKVADKQLECVGTAKDGQWLVLKDPVTGEKREIYDAISGAAVCSLKHGDTEILSQMNDFAKQSAYTFCANFSNTAAEELAEFMCSKSEGAFSSAMYVCSGSEANEQAMRYAMQYHIEKGDRKRYKFISRVNAYHGYLVGALSIGDNPMKPLLKKMLLSDDQVPKISRLMPYRDQGDLTEEQYCKKLLDNLEETIVSTGQDEVAAVILETVSGSSIGNSVPPKGYLDGVKALCDKYGALLILDEVMCGLGRCGYPFTFMDPEFGLTAGGPDLLTFGKTVGAGIVPLSGVMVAPKVVNAIREGSGVVMGYQTYHSHYLNCSVGLAVQKKIYRDNLIENVREVGAYTKAALKAALKDSKVAGDVRGAGNFISVELVKDKATKESFAPELKMHEVLNQKTFAKGIHFMCIPGTNGYEYVDDKLVMNGAHLTMAPAFGFTKTDADLMVKVIAETFAEIEKEYL
ncbi:hypothetical protein OGAPHI_003155 [Ogataea philodendri]|uniref:Aminotransferase n=1 Tax=Ogataea philodendri TaxID=1378263 RepID=A0A9P8T716_9ASCO|nr:uncharacterized protein OGAPHI_003155 [Ogataea philodendri]KAH3667506.1 hypothetical protein OGAPHI_003155 [Ogataea philodendri]